MRVRKKIDRFLGISLSLIMGILVIDVLWQVASRYLLSTPSPFTDELAGFLLIWVGLLGAAYITGTHGHLAIDLLPSKLNPENKKKLNLLINILITAFAITVLIIGGSWLVYTRFKFGQISASLSLPLGYVYSVLPISGIFIVYYSLSNSYLEYKSNIE